MTSERVVVIADAGPIIALSIVGHLDVLGRLFHKVLVPEAIYSEVVDEGSGRTGSRELAPAAAQFLGEDAVHERADPSNSALRNAGRRGRGSRAFGRRIRSPAGPPCLPILGPLCLPLAHVNPAAPKIRRHKPQRVLRTLTVSRRNAF